MLRMLSTHVKMSTLVQQTFTPSPFITIPSVRVVVYSEPRPVVLGAKYEEYGPRYCIDTTEEIRNSYRSLETLLSRRDWREIRQSFLNLNIDDATAVCKWLGSAGYVPQGVLDEPNATYFTGPDVKRMLTVHFGWLPDLVTPEIRGWLSRHRDVFAWLMKLDQPRFQKAVRPARELFVNELETRLTEVQAIQQRGKKPRLKDPGDAFLSAIGAPTDLDVNVLGLALRGTAISEAAPGMFYWDDDGRPGVIVRADSPIAAICLSIHFDRNFSSRSWTQCDRCGKWLDQIRGRDRYCSKKCRNYCTTKHRRTKLKLLKQGANAWEGSPVSNRNADECQWIATWMRRQSRGRVQVDRSWVAQQLLSSKAQKRTRTGSQAKLQRRKNVTGKTR